MEIRIVFVYEERSSWSAGVPAALVLSSLVILRPSYVDNTHRRFVCRPVGRDEWRAFCSYAAAGRTHWSSALPRHVARTCSSSATTKRGTSRRAESARSAVERRPHDDVMADSRRADAQQNTSAPPLLHSPRRHRYRDGYCGENSLQPRNSAAAAEHSGEAALAKTATTGSSALVKNVSKARTVGQETRRTLSPDQCLAPSSDLLQPPKFEDKQLQKPAVRVISRDICRRESVPVSGKNIAHSGCQSPVSEQYSLLEAATIRSAIAKVQTGDVTGTSVDVSTDAASDCNAKCSSPVDLLPIDSAAVYDAHDGVARSSDSISSILSAAAERSRAAKLAFLGFSLADDCQPVVDPPANLGRRAAGGPFPAPARSDDASLVSCSSSGIGSSVSGSPVDVSPDENNAVVSAVDQSAAAAAAALSTCTGRVSCQYAQQLHALDSGLQSTYTRTVQLTDRSKQTSV